MITNKGAIEAIKELIKHCKRLEYELDLTFGLGNDAGSGYSSVISNAEGALAALSRPTYDPTTHVAVPKPFPVNNKAFGKKAREILDRQSTRDALAAGSADMLFDIVQKSFTAMIAAAEKEKSDE